jgi:16S rRNA G966 N2-methylase RsmD
MPTAQYLDEIRKEYDPNNEAAHSSEPDQGPPPNIPIELQNNLLSTVPSLQYENKERISGPIIVTDFISWSASYRGPKFNFVHCDFPYGNNAADATLEHYENNRRLFLNLTEALVTNLDNILSYSAHVMFWLSFEYYEQIKKKLNSAGLHVINRPLIWVRSDSHGAAPGIKGTQPRHSYEICLLAYRGNRPLVKQGTDSHAANTVSKPIHPTQKPESMLKHFFSMLVDNVTDFLDPTCGSGSSLRAAEDLGARYVVGIERDKEYADAANVATLNARRLRNASKEGTVSL